jgi:hypothetical protein
MGAPSVWYYKGNTRISVRQWLRPKKGRGQTPALARLSGHLWLQSRANSRVSRMGTSINPHIPAVIVLDEFFC